MVTDYWFLTLVQLARGQAMHTMPKLGYADTPSIIIAACYCAEWRTGTRWQLAFNSLVVMFHSCCCLICGTDATV